MRIDLDLTKHCVETEIKRVYHRALASYFKTGADTAHLEQIIALTQQALERLDFSFLRSQYLPLAGHSAVPVTLVWHEQDRRPVILIAGSAVSYAEKKSLARE
jgi:hypothetical protein